MAGGSPKYWACLAYLRMAPQAEILALRVLAEKLEQGESRPEPITISIAA